MVTKDMSISEILNMDERMTGILVSHGLNCQGCPGAESETLEEAAQGHNVNYERLLTDLNAVLELK